ncbi:hypothetical protein FPV67DRAFT_1753646 [Lyophyllum atratum]|nr:hypothetical protein FPV67DRAFT_1753646 [Lyophyllum atratum]
MDGGDASMEAVVTLLKESIVVRYTNVAFLMLLLYDYIITFHTEVERIWSLQWRLPKILFLLNRYIVPPMLMFNGLTPSVHLGEEICDFIGKWTAWPTILSMGIVDAILVLRVVVICGYRFPKILYSYRSYALYRRWPEQATLASWLGVALAITFNTDATPGSVIFTGCLYVAPPYFYAAWLSQGLTSTTPRIPPVFFESIIIVFTIHKVVKYDRVHMILLANLFLARYGQGFMGALLIQPCCVVACVAAARMTMNIREFTMNKDHHATEFELPPIRFHSRDYSTQGVDTELTRSWMDNAIDGTRIDPGP